MRGDGALALGDGDDAEGVEQVEQVAGLDALVVVGMKRHQVAPWSSSERHLASASLNRACHQGRNRRTMEQLKVAREIKSMTLSARINVDPKVLLGKPVVRGTRLSVDFLLELMAEGWSTADILDQYPGLTEPDLRACLDYAVTILRAERVYPAAAE